MGMFLVFSYVRIKQNDARGCFSGVWRIFFKSAFDAGAGTWRV